MGSPAGRPSVAKPAVPRSPNIVQVDPKKIELPSAEFTYVPGHRNERMLILCGDELAEVARDGITLQNKVKLPKPYIALAERETYYVAVAADPDKVVDLVDKKTLKVVKSLNLVFSQFTDLVPHPTLPICYLAYRYTTGIPSCKFVVFDEKTAKAYTDEDYIATWIAVDPAGRFLITGYRDVYQAGNELLINPGRLHIVPTYGSLDWLLNYKLGADGKPQLATMRDEIGTNGKGLRMAPDAGRLTYVSFTGSPHSRGNLVGFDPRKLDENPITYRVKDKGTCQELAFHPSLPLAASPGGGGATFFHRDEGFELPGYLDADAVPAGAAVQRLWFSVDGRNAVFRIVVNEIDYLVSAPLKLSPVELERVTTAPAIPTVAPEVPRSVVSVPRQSLEALQTAARKPLTGTEIGREFFESVLVIDVGEGGGTGFVVGSRGYVLTCAHVVGQETNVMVIKPGENGGPGKKRTAKVIRKDDERDLALLKIASTDPWKPVRFNTTAKVEAGERVIVIGNPGAGATILTHTMTEGIVSTPDRKIADQAFIQTSAAVNPGTSGAPMFDGCGEVIGLVVLKARIEGAGFAVPVPDLIAFLTGDPAAPAAAASFGKPAEPGQSRTWTDATGQFKIEAEFVSSADGTVSLRKPNGEVITVPLDKLSDDDRKYLKARASR
jgi:S1-C subfamily serine protease